jgi:hypothetical protein
MTAVDKLGRRVGLTIKDVDDLGIPIHHDLYTLLDHLESFCAGDVTSKNFIIVPQAVGLESFKYSI